MRAIIKKLLFEFWLSKGKFLLCVLAASIAVWGVSSVVYGYLMTERDFKANFESTNPAHFAITVNGYKNDITSLIKNDAQIASFERREILQGRIKDSKDLWMTVIIQGVEDFNTIKLDRFEIIKKYDSSATAMLIEQNAVDFLSYESDSVAIQFLPDFKEWQFVKARALHDPRMPPAQMEKVVYAYTTIEALKPFLNPDSVRLIIETKGLPATEKGYRAFAEKLKAGITNKGAVVTAINVPEPGKHLHQPIIDGISILQRTFGIVLIVLGIALLSLIWLTWLFPQLLQTGIMKALGASNKKILNAYLFVLCLIIFIGLLIGMPAGYKTAVFYNGFVAKIQNFTPVTDAFPFYILASVILISSILPFLAGAIQLRKVVKTTVRDALGTTFHNTNLLLVKWLYSFQTSARQFYITSNLLRNGVRTGLLFALLTAGTALYFTGINLSYSMRTDIEDYYGKMNYEITINLADTTGKKTDFLEKLPFVESISYLRTQRISYKLAGQSKTMSGLMRFYPNDFKLDNSYFQKGKRDSSCSDCIFFHPVTAKNEFPTAKIGDIIETTWKDGSQHFLKYAGVLKEGGAHGGLMYQFLTTGNPFFSQVMVNIKEGIPLEKAIKEIETALQKNAVTIKGISNIEKLMDGSISHLQPTFSVVQYMGLFTLLVGFAGMLIILGLVIKERVLETGIMKAVGASAKDISRLLLKEFSILSLVAFAAGILLSLFFTGVLTAFMGNLMSGQEVPPLFNYNIVLAAALIYFALQSLIIFTFALKSLNKTSHSLLTRIE